MKRKTKILVNPNILETKDFTDKEREAIFTVYRMIMEGKMKKWKLTKNERL